MCQWNSASKMPRCVQLGTQHWHVAPIRHGHVSEWLQPCFRGHSRMSQHPESHTAQPHLFGSFAKTLIHYGELYGAETLGFVCMSVSQYEVEWMEVGPRRTRDWTLTSDLEMASETPDLEVKLSWIAWCLPSAPPFWKPSPTPYKQTLAGPIQRVV